MIWVRCHPFLLAPFIVRCNHDATAHPSVNKKKHGWGMGFRKRGVIIFWCSFSNSKYCVCKMYMHFVFLWNWLHIYNFRLAEPVVTVLMHVVEHMNKVAIIWKDGAKHKQLLVEESLRLITFFWQKKKKKLRKFEIWCQLIIRDTIHSL